MVNNEIQTTKTERIYTRFTAHEKKYYAALAAGLGVNTSTLIRNALEAYAKAVLKMKHQTIPEINLSGGVFDTSGERFLFNVVNNPFGYVSRLRSVAAEDNPRWSGHRLTSLIRGREWEVMVAARLLSLGLNDVSLTPNFDGDEAGNADIWVNNTHIVEVKSYNYRFNSAADFPYPNVFTNSIADVNTKHQLALSRGGSLIFVVCSQQTGGMIFTRYQPDADYNQTRLNNNKVETLIISRECWYSLEDLAEYVVKHSSPTPTLLTNNPKKSYQLLEGSNNKHNTTNPLNVIYS